MSSRWRHRLLHAALSLPGAVFFAGCKGLDTTRDIGFYTVTAKQTRIYRFAPGQVSAGDLTLAQGERVVMLRREYGYSRVLTGSGEKGFVATNDVGPAPPEPKVAAPVPRNAPAGLAGPPRRSSGVSSANRSVIQSGSLFEPGEVLPLPQDPDAPQIQPAPPTPPKPNQKPGFRVTPPRQSEGPSEKPSPGQ